MGLDQSTILELREEVEDIHTALAKFAGNRPVFDLEADRIAEEYAVSPITIRAIGLGAITTSLQITDRVKFVIYHYV